MRELALMPHLDGAESTILMSRKRASCACLLPCMTLNTNFTFTSRKRKIAMKTVLFRSVWIRHKGHPHGAILVQAAS